MHQKSVNFPFSLCVEPVTFVPQKHQKSNQISSGNLSRGQKNKQNVPSCTVDLGEVLSLYKRTTAKAPAATAAMPRSKLLAALPLTWTGSEVVVLPEEVVTVPTDLMVVGV